jgi:hypothetical protein
MNGLRGASVHIINKRWSGDFQTAEGNTSALANQK